jgi:hypothetical protein
MGTFSERAKLSVEVKLEWRLRERIGRQAFEYRRGHNKHSKPISGCLLPEKTQETFVFNSMAHFYT